MTTYVETRKSYIVYPHLGIKEEVEEEVFVAVEEEKERPANSRQRRENVFTVSKGTKKTRC